MAHVYADLARFKDFVKESGSTTLGTGNDAAILGVLESASRRIDQWCGRGSGFGPVAATLTLDGSGNAAQRLGADLASAPSSVTSRPHSSATAGTSLTVTTDYLVEGPDGWGRYPARKLWLHGRGALAAWGTGYAVTDVAGTWGYPVVWRDTGLTTAEALDDSEQVCDMSAVTALSPGMTLLVESEQLYVSAVTAGLTPSVTADRGCNGTTAASHLTGRAVSRCVYDAAVVDACLRVALRRWQSRDGAADGSDAAYGGGTVQWREGEDKILERTIGHLRIGLVP